MNLDHDTPDGDNRVNDNNDDNNDHDNSDGIHESDNNDYDNNNNGDDNNHVRYCRQFSLEKFLLVKNLKFFHLLICMYVPVLLFCCSVFACYFADLMFSGCEIISL